MTRRDVALLILILLLGGIVTTAQKIRRGFCPRVHVEGLEFLQGPLHTFTDSQEAPQTPGGRLTLEAGTGDVEVMTWSEPKVRVEMQKQVHMESEERAASEVAGFRLEITRTPEGLLARTSGTRPAGVETRFTVMVPAQGGLHVMSESGSVEVQGVKGEVLIKTSHGDVEGSDLAGRLEIVNDGGAVTLRRAQGPVTIRTAHGDVEASDVSGGAEVSCNDGDVKLSRIGGDLKMTHAHGDVTVSEARAAVRLDARNSEIVLEDIHGPVDLTNEHGSIRLERIEAEARLVVPHCTLTLRDLRGNLAATVQGDSLEATSVRGTVKVESSAGSVKLTDVLGAIEVTGTHTPVEVIRPGSDVTVTTSNQEIELASPSRKGFRLDARSDQGEVESDMDQLHLPEDRPSRFAGVVGGGVARYRLSTSHSTISIRSTSPETAEDKAE
ncbi:MAG TPA: DUF4097 family beta strand repeat-containing protein [Candidatus Polarisedimenticolia bacterium]|nr:DUF4097 family beta strand repeat-containing protein [Candidatus Polarisedimenticolia bacterium]